MTEESVTGMECAIEQAARIIHGCTGDEDGAPVAARALAEAGLLAPAPLTEEWGIWGEDDAGEWEVGDGFKCREEAEQFMEKNPWTREMGGYLVRRPVHDWLPVGRAEGNGSAEP